MGYSPNTPCWVVERATWEDEAIYKGTISNIENQVSHIRGVALILFGDFLYQEESEESHLYVKQKTYKKGGYIENSNRNNQPT